LSFSSPSSDFVLLATTTASGTSASVAFDGYFSSTYDNYMLIGYDNYSSATSGNHTVQIRLRRSNADISTGNYHRNTYGRRVFSSGDDVGGTNSTWNGDAVVLNPNTQTESTGGAFTNNFIVNIYNPLSATNYKYGHYQYDNYSAINDQFHSYNGGFVLKDSTSALSGITIFVPSGNIYGKFKLYGIK